MDQKLDEASYQEGRAAFAAGATIRSIVEQCASSDATDDLKIMSAAIGFADALLGILRRPLLVAVPTERPAFPSEVVIENGDGTVTLLAHVDVIQGTIRARRAGDVIRGERS